MKFRGYPTFKGWLKIKLKEIFCWHVWFPHWSVTAGGEYIFDECSKCGKWRYRNEIRRGD